MKSWTIMAAALEPAATAFATDGICVVARSDQAGHAGVERRVDLDGPVELIMIVGPQGERLHLHA